MAGHDEKSTYYISSQDHKMFVNLVLIPALKTTFDESLVYIPSSFEGAAINGLGKTFRLNYRELQKLVSNMRIEAANCGNASEKFNDFFFTTYGYGLKSRMGLEESFMDALSYIMFDWEKMDLSRFYLDYGINIGTKAHNKTGFFFHWRGKFFFEHYRGVLWR